VCDRPAGFEVRLDGRRGERPRDLVDGLLDDAVDLAAEAV